MFYWWANRLCVKPESWHDKGKYLCKIYQTSDEIMRSSFISNINCSKNDEGGQNLQI